MTVEMRGIALRSIDYSSYNENVRLAYLTAQPGLFMCATIG